MTVAKDETQIVTFLIDRVPAIPSSEIVRRGAVQMLLRDGIKGAYFEVIITTSFEKALKIRQLNLKNEPHAVTNRDLLVH